MARLEYGRIDYSLLGGKPQVWEINTNPIVMQEPGRYDPRHLPAQEWFAPRICRAFDAVDGPAGPPARIALPMVARVQVGCETTARRLQLGVRRRLQAPLTAPVLQALEPVAAAGLAVRRAWHRRRQRRPAAHPTLA
jgi:hypothetical protein